MAGSRVGSSLKSKVLAVVVILFSVIFAELYIVRLHWESRAIIYRVHYVLLIEMVLLIMTICVWRVFETVFKFDTLTNISIIDIVNVFRPLNVTLKKNKGTISDKLYLLKCIWKPLLFSYLFLCHFSYFTNLFFIGKDPYLIAFLCYVALGSFIQLLVGMCFFGLLELFYKYFLKKQLGLSLKLKLISSITYSLMMSCYGLYNAAYAPTIKAYTVPIKKLPDSFEGFCIVQLTDIHLGPTVGNRKMMKIVENANQLNPDIVVLTGDLVDGSVARLKEAAEPLVHLQSKYGKYFITGNHEYYTGDVDNWFIYLRELGFTILNNSNVKLLSLQDTLQQICLAGTDDLQANKIGYGDHGMDLDKALGTCDPDYPTVLLCHQPKAAKLALDSTYRIDLVIAGHTHGGQMFPFMIPVYLMNPFYAGLYRYKEDSSVYVSMGTQYWGVPMRILTTMEITKLVLKKRM